MTVTVLRGNCLELLTTLPNNSVHCCVTSPPYWGLRDYGIPPTIWGGNPNCRHEWGSMNRGKRKDILPAGETSLTCRIGTDDRQNGAATHGGRFCPKCGAWLGVFGLEPTPELYVEHSVLIFREIRRVLRSDGTLWLNLGDSYWSKPNGTIGASGLPDMGKGHAEYRRTNAMRKNRPPHQVLKHKDLVGIPWEVAFALRADGWYLRSDIIWAKPNPMPESVRDRPTKAHEYLFLLTKSPRYFYDIEATKEHAVSDHPSGNGFKRDARLTYTDANGPRGNDKQWTGVGGSRNLRSVWTLTTRAFPGAHFATFPPRLIEPCIKAGTSEKGCCSACGAPLRRVVNKSYVNPGNRTTNGPRSIERKHLEYGTAGFSRRLEKRTETIGWEPTCDCNAGAPVPCVVLDPFGGAGTTGLTAERLGRDAILIELNPEYAEMTRQRIQQEAPLLADVKVSESNVEGKL